MCSQNSSVYCAVRQTNNYFFQLRFFYEMNSFEGTHEKPILRRDDIKYLLENTTFDEYDIREWFREFVKVQGVPKNCGRIILIFSIYN